MILRAFTPLQIHDKSEIQFPASLHYQTEFGNEGEHPSHPMETTLSIVLGGLVSILITIAVEYFRRPRLRFSIVSPPYVLTDKAKLPQSKFLEIVIRNAPLPWLFRWMSRNAAIQCHAFITFHHLDGQILFDRSMVPRWSSAPEPRPVSIRIGGQTGEFFDQDKFQRAQRVDIQPGESDKLCVVAKHKDYPEDCWGWSNESYFSEPRWRNENWKLPPGRYLAVVTVIAAGERATCVFRVRNDVPSIEDCRLEITSDVERKNAMKSHPSAF